MPTLTEMRQGSRDEQALVGLWDIRDSDMPTRYAGDRDRSGDIVRHLNAEIVRCCGEAKEAVSWPTMRAFLVDFDIPACRAGLIRALAGEMTVEAAPEVWVARYTAMPEVFQVGSMRFARRNAAAGSRKPSGEAKVLLPTTSEGDRNLSICQPSSPSQELRWVAIAWKEQELVHLLDGDDRPFCNRRQKESKKFVNICGSGETAQRLKSLGLRRDQLCPRCLAKSTPEISLLATRCCKP
jgi:hypothetical protein